MGSRKESPIQWIRNFKIRLYEEGKKRALEIKQMKEEIRINISK